MMNDPQGHATIVILVTETQASTRVDQLLSDQDFLVLILEDFAFDDPAAWSLFALDSGGNHTCSSASRAADGGPSGPRQRENGFGARVGRSRLRSGPVSPRFELRNSAVAACVVGTRGVYSRRTDRATKFWTLDATVSAAWRPRFKLPIVTLTWEMESRAVLRVHRSAMRIVHLQRRIGSSG